MLESSSSKQNECEQPRSFMQKPRLDLDAHLEVSDVMCVSRSNFHESVCHVVMTYV